MTEENISKLKIDRAELAQKSRPAKRMRLYVVAAILIAVALFWFISGRRAVQIETTTVSLQYPSSAFTLLNASGYLVAQRKAALASKTTGRLEWLGVEEGSRVKAGDMIARLEGLDSEAAQRQAQAAVNVAIAQKEQADVELLDAGRSFARAKELLAQGVVSRAEYDMAEAREARARAAVSSATASLAASRAALRSAEVAVDYTKIRAPFDGVILTKNADVGDIVTPLGAAANAKASVVTLADLSSLKVEVDVSESSIGKVKAGQPCEILLDALPQERFAGVVHSVVPTADRSKATVLVKVGFVGSDSRRLPEMSAKVAFLERLPKADEKTPRVMLLKDAVRKDGDRHYVFVVDSGRVRRSELQIVSASGDLLEVKGVKAGEKVALKPLDRLSDGKRVRSGEK